MATRHPISEFSTFLLALSGSYEGFQPIAAFVTSLLTVPILFVVMAEQVHKARDHWCIGCLALHPAHTT
ncbi:hypothetical protein M408DRAFT_219600 [Serendipita vermifera MAFF 305830]|uniref:Uncharacterized protein n=1 Tax=Serendipita vermifera MAFF 305830 TaxID=933852 RepID=A0A0C2X2I5_SERVB|nr:hypothetical protein M408DRAFT_219600 [Serendipita vermifera MAFF 305830]